MDHKVTGTSSGDHRGGGGRWSMEGARHRARERGRRGRDGAHAHQESAGVDGEAGGGRTAATRGGEELDGDGNCGVPGPIPSAWRRSFAGR